MTKQKFRWPRGKRVGESRRQEEPEITNGNMRLGRDGRFVEEQRAHLAREHWGGTRRRSPLREGQKCLFTKKITIMITLKTFESIAKTNFVFGVLDSSTIL